jgi:anti-sigma factor RsiW
MRKPKCEEIRIATMALADGEQAPLASEDIQAHLAACAACRREAEQMGTLAALWARQARLPSAGDLWPGMAERLRKTAADPPATWGQEVIWPLALLLGAYKVIESVPDHPWPLAMQLLPALIAGAWLLWRKENPFRVEVGLSMEGGE